MKYVIIFDKLRFQFFLFPFFIALAALVLPYGCNQDQTSEKQKPTSEVTLQNLQTAYAKSIKHHAMYALFAKNAEQERLATMANLYHAVARSEEIHATNHASLMRSHGIEPKMPPLDSLSVGTTLQTLKMALSCEEIEIESMYSNLIRTAELEKFTDALDQFEKTKSADARQTELMKEALDKNAKIQKVPYFVCAGCGYILTSEKTDECPTCHNRKEQFIKI
jgi:rubrerythrin